jgi:hypothetical protein
LTSHAVERFIQRVQRDRQVVLDLLTQRGLMVR